MSDAGSSVTLIFYRMQDKWWKEPWLNLAAAACQMSALTHVEIGIGGRCQTLQKRRPSRCISLSDAVCLRRARGAGRPDRKRVQSFQYARTASTPHPIVPRPCGSLSRPIATQTTTRASKSWSAPGATRSTSTSNSAARRTPSGACCTTRGPPASVARFRMLAWRGRFCGRGRRTTRPFFAPVCLALH